LHCIVTSVFVAGIIADPADHSSGARKSIDPAEFAILAWVGWFNHRRTVGSLDTGRLLHSIFWEWP